MTKTKAYFRDGVSDNIAYPLHITHGEGFTLHHSILSFLRRHLLICFHCITVKLLQCITVNPLNVPLYKYNLPKIKTRINCSLYVGYRGSHVACS